MNRTFKAALLASMVLASTAISIAAQVREPSGTTQESIKDTTSDSTIQAEKSASGAESRFNAKKGQAWLGGSFGYMSIGGERKVEDYERNSTTYMLEKTSKWEKQDREGVLVISPITRFFPANNFCLGPKFGWTGSFQKDYSRNAISLGGDIGFVGSRNLALPYVLVSPHVLITSVNSQNNSSLNVNSWAKVRDTSITHFVLPVTGGLMIPSGKSGIGLQVEVGYSMSFEENVKQNMFFVGFGVCGLGQKVAISFLNVIGMMSGMY